MYYFILCFRILLFERLLLLGRPIWNIIPSLNPHSPLGQQPQLLYTKLHTMICLHFCQYSFLISHFTLMSLSLFTRHSLLSSPRLEAAAAAAALATSAAASSRLHTRSRPAFKSRMTSSNVVSGCDSQLQLSHLKPLKHLYVSIVAVIPLSQAERYLLLRYCSILLLTTWRFSNTYSFHNESA